MMLVRFIWIIGYILFNTVFIFIGLITGKIKNRAYVEDSNITIFFIFPDTLLRPQGDAVRCVFIPK